jgi:hypothetical protein
MKKQFLFCLAISIWFIAGNSVLLSQGTAKDYGRAKSINSLFSG